MFSVRKSRHKLAGESSPVPVSSACHSSHSKGPLEDKSLDREKVEKQGAYNQLSSPRQTAAEHTNRAQAWRFYHLCTSSPVGHHADCTASVGIGNELETRTLVPHRLSLLDTLNNGLAYNLSTIDWRESGIHSMETVF